MTEEPRFDPDKLEAFLARIAEFTDPIPGYATDRERTLALLLDQVGAHIAHTLRGGRPVGLLPFRVNQFLEAVKAENEEMARKRDERASLSRAELPSKRSASDVHVQAALAHGPQIDAGRSVGGLPARPGDH